MSQVAGRRMVIAGRKTPAATSRALADPSQTVMRSLDGIVEAWPAGLVRLYGFDADAVVGKKLHDVLRTCFQMPRRSVEEELARSATWSGTLVQVRADMSRIVVMAQWHLLRDRRGREHVAESYVALSGQTEDMETKSHLAAIVNGSNDAIIGKTLDGVVTSWNRAAENIFGYAASEMIGRSITQIIPPDLLGEEAVILAQISRGENISHYETTRRRKDGSLVPVALTISPVANASGSIVGASKFARDISEAKALRERLYNLRSELARTARSSAMSEVATSLCHELNQPVTAIVNYLEVLRSLLAEDGVASDMSRSVVERIAKQAARTGEMIHGIRDFVINQRSSQQMHDVNELVRDVVQLAEAACEATGVRIETDLDPGVERHKVDRSQIEQVLTNLLRNAFDALAASPCKHVVIATRRNPSGGIAITVADTGPGLAPQIAARLFTPFNTSKPSGLGIGLSICKDIVRAHGGDIVASCPPSGGTVFTVSLPIPHDGASPEPSGSG